DGDGLRAFQAGVAGGAAPRGSGDPCRAAGDGGLDSRARHRGGPRGGDQPRVPVHQRPPAPDHPGSARGDRRRRAHHRDRWPPVRDRRSGAAALGAGGSGGEGLNLITDAFAWMFSENPYAGGSSIPWAVGEHVLYTFLSVLLASLVAIPIGWWIGHTGKGKDAVVALSGAGRAIPSFGLLVLLVLVIGVTRKPEAAVLTYALLAFAAVLSGAYSGV